MRTISAASLAKLAQTHGTEPVSILEVIWYADGPTASYADRDLAGGIQGKVIDIDGLDEVLQVSQGSSSSEVTVTLDDTDGTIKDILDTNDIHKRPCYIYQWFTGIDLSEKFLVFQGQISSPIRWRESDRTVTFTVITKLEDREVGFSPEEGQFPAIPKNLIGQPWPMCFGTVLDVKAVPINQASTANLGEGTGIHDFTIPYQIGALSLQDGWLTDLIVYWGTVEAVLRGIGDDTAADAAHQNQLSAAQTQIQVRAQIIELTAALAEQKSYETSPVRVIGVDEFPQNESTVLLIGEGIFRGKFINNLLHIEDREHPDAQNFCNYKGLFLGHNPPGGIETNCRKLPRILGTGPGQPGSDQIEGEQAGFFWANGGSQIKIYGNEPIDYVVSIVPGTVLRVAAKRVVEGTKQLVQVPGSYYTVSTKTFGTISAVIVTVNKALSLLDGEGWDDDLYVTFQSDVGPNTVDVIEYIIEQYLPELTTDSTSFDYVKTRLEPYPSHFALFEKKNVVDVLKEIAFQARCAIWVAGTTVYMRYLAEEPDSVLTITESDIDTDDGHSTMEVETTATEDLVTKYTGKWFESYVQDEPNRVILRHNVNKYGTLEREDDFYIYNDQDLVIKSMTFWLIRFANTWKRIKFRTAIHTLKAETMDAVTLDFNQTYIASVDVKGIIERAVFDSNSRTIDYEIWTPVKAGTLVPYDFAWPADVDQELIFPTIEEETAGNAGGGPGGPSFGATGELQTGWRNVSYREDNHHDYGDPHPSDIGDVKKDAKFPGVDTGPVNNDPGLTTPTYQQNPVEEGQVPYFINLRETSIFDPQTGQSAKLSSFFFDISAEKLRMNTTSTLTDGTNSGEFVFTWNDEVGKFVPDVAELKDD